MSESNPAAPAYARSAVRRIAVWVCGISFAATVFPCFLKMTSGEMLAFGALGFNDFSMATFSGGIAGGALCLVLDRFRARTATGDFVRTCFAVLLYCSGYLVSFTVPFIGGVLFGIGVVLLCAAWTVCMSARDFKRTLAGISLVVVCAVLLDQIVFSLHAEIAEAVSIVMLMFGTLPPLAVLWKARKGGFTHAASEERTESDYDGIFQAEPSLKEVVKVLSSSMVGLVVFAVYSNAINDPFPGVGVSGTSFGLAAASLAVFLVTRFGKKKLTAPFVYWVLFPAIAAVLLVLDSFPIDSQAFMIGATGITVFCSGLGVFAIAFLLMVTMQKQIAPLRAIGLAFVVFSVSGLAGCVLRQSGLTSDERGSILLVVSTVYMVYLLFSPALQLWDLRKAAPVRADGSAIGTDDIETVCARFSRRYGLSRREEEVLVYVGQGYNSPYIAKVLFISDSTVRSHLKSIYRKADVASRMDLVDLIRKESAPPA